MGMVIDHILAEIPDAGTYDPCTAGIVAKICTNATRLPVLALELFPSAPYTRTGIMTLPLWTDYKMVYIFLKAFFHGYKGTLILIVQENVVNALSVQLRHDDREIKIVEGMNFTIRDNRGMDLGSFDSIPAIIAELDRVLGVENANR